MDTTIPTVSLPSSIPAIKIIKPSPMSAINITEQEPQLQKLNEVPEKPVEVDSSENSPIKEDSVAVSVDSDNDYKAVPECNVCDEGMNEKEISKSTDEKMPLQTDTPDTTRLQISSDEDNDLIVNNSGWNGNGFLGKWYKFSEATTAPSRFSLFILLVSLVLPIVICGEAVNHVNECPMSDGITVLVFSVGQGLIILILCRIFQVIRKITNPEENDFVTKVSIVCGCFILLLLLSYEILRFFSNTPSFKSTDPNYCHPVFYKSAYVMNCATPVAFLLGILAHMPKCLVANQQRRMS